MLEDTKTEVGSHHTWSCFLRASTSSDISCCIWVNAACSSCCLCPYTHSPQLSHAPTSLHIETQCLGCAHKFCLVTAPFLATVVTGHAIISRVINTGIFLVSAAVCYLQGCADYFICHLPERGAQSNTANRWMFAHSASSWRQYVFQSIDRLSRQR